MSVLGYMDVVLIALAAPIMLLIGVPAAGYGIGAGAWIVLRLVGVGVEHGAGATKDFNRRLGLKLAYMLGRLFTLAIVIILVRKSDGRDSGLAALAVIVFAFTIQLALSAATRPRPGSRPGLRSGPRSR